MVPKSYKIHIVEGKQFIVVSVLFAVFIRVAFYFLSSDINSHFESEGYLWILISPLFDNVLLSLLGSILCIIIIAIQTFAINTEHNLIRRRTALMVTFSVLLFSCHPALFLMNPYYIAAICILYAISALFASYGDERKQSNTFRVSFLIALGSLFAPYLLFYIPIFWVGLVMVRSFNFKSIFASFFGILIAYFPVFTYFLYLNQLDKFIRPFVSITLEQLANIPVLRLNYIDYAILGFAIFMLIMVIINNFMTSYKDKIRVRSLISYLNILVVFALLLALFLNIDPTVNIYVALCTSILLLSHFFALAEDKWIVYLFYFFISFYLIICFLTFFTF